MMFFLMSHGECWDNHTLYSITICTPFPHVTGVDGWVDERRRKGRVMGARKLANTGDLWVVNYDSVYIVMVGVPDAGGEDP